MCVRSEACLSDSVELLRYPNRPLAGEHQVLHCPASVLRGERVCRGNATSPQEPRRTVYCGLLGLVDSRPRWLSELGILGACLSGGNLKSWGTRYWVQTLHSSGRNWELGVASRL